MQKSLVAYYFFLLINATLPFRKRFCLQKYVFVMLNLNYITNMSFFFSLQCGRQIAQLKDEYEESKKNLEEEASRLRQVSILYVLHFFRACF